MEDIRLDEETVLKTAGVNTLRGSSPWSSALIECHSPVAQRRRNLVYTQSIDGSSPSRTTHWNDATPLGAVRELVQRRSLNLRDCGFESRLRQGR